MKKPDITKPYRPPINVDNKPLKALPRLNWFVRTADPQKSFSFSSGSEWDAMHIWRTQCDGSEILHIQSSPRNH